MHEHEQCRHVAFNQSRSNRLLTAKNQRCLLFERLSEHRLLVTGHQCRGVGAGAYVVAGGWSPSPILPTLEHVQLTSILLFLASKSGDNESVSSERFLRLSRTRKLDKDSQFAGSLLGVVGQFTR